jgi:hypothetical protein
MAFADRLLDQTLHLSALNGRDVTSKIISYARLR